MCAQAHVTCCSRSCQEVLRAQLCSTRQSRPTCALPDTNSHSEHMHSECSLVWGVQPAVLPSTCRRQMPWCSRGGRPASRQARSLRANLPWSSRRRRRRQRWLQTRRRRLGSRQLGGRLRHEQPRGGWLLRGLGLLGERACQRSTVMAVALQLQTRRQRLRWVRQVLRRGRAPRSVLHGSGGRRRLAAGRRSGRAERRRQRRAGLLYSIQNPRQPCLVQTPCSG